jgi:hypothetical protein
MTKRQKKHKRKESRKHLHQWSNLSYLEIAEIDKRVHLMVMKRRLNPLIDKAKQILANTDKEQLKTMFESLLRDLR